MLIEVLAAAAFVAGRSADGHVLAARALGPGTPAVLVFGCIHGTECAGTAIVHRIVRECAAGRVPIWVVPNLNPDGLRRNVRQNARGVDLNRNFPTAWQPRGRAWDAEYAGPRRASEPETQAAMRIVHILRPQVTIWYHQPLTLVRAWGASVAPARHYAYVARTRFRRLPWLAGTAPNWQNHAFPGTASFVVELPPGRLRPSAVRRHARAVESLAGGC